jgi:hypothetical protein
LVMPRAFSAATTASTSFFTTSCRAHSNAQVSELYGWMDAGLQGICSDAAAAVCECLEQGHQRWGML